MGVGRYDVKAAAGWSRTRRDGSDYSREVDRVSGLAEAWAAEQFHCSIDDTVGLGGDPGYDFIILMPNGQQCHVDAVHAGLLKDGSPRLQDNAHLILNQDSKKFDHTDVLVIVFGQPGDFQFGGAITMVRFREVARLKQFGFGEKWALHATDPNIRDVWVTLMEWT